MFTHAQHSLPAAGKQASGLLSVMGFSPQRSLLWVLSWEILAPPLPPRHLPLHVGLLWILPAHPPPPGGPSRLGDQRPGTTALEKSTLRDQVLLLVASLQLLLSFSFRGNAACNGSQGHLPSLLSSLNF